MHRAFRPWKRQKSRQKSRFQGRNSYGGRSAFRLMPAPSSWTWWKLPIPVQTLLATGQESRPLKPSTARGRRGSSRNSPYRGYEARSIDDNQVSKAHKFYQRKLPGKRRGKGHEWVLALLHCTGGLETMVIKPAMLMSFFCRHPRLKSQSH